MTRVADNSFLLFIYPFLFDGSTFGERVKAIESKTVVVTKRTKSETGERQNQNARFWLKVPSFPRDEMLAYIADYLNPREKDAEATAQMWVLNEELENSYGLFGRADWQLRANQSRKEPWSFDFGAKGGGNWAVHLMLFRDGVGFLSVRIQPVSRELNDWLEIAHFFRFVKGQRRVSVAARVGVGFDQNTQQQLYEPFFPDPAGGIGSTPARSAVFDMVLDSLLFNANRDHEKGKWWRDVFVPEQLIPFAAIFVNDLEPASDLSIAYKLRHFFRPSQGENPAPHDLTADHPALFAYAERQWFIFSLAGGAFLACEPPNTDFLNITMPHHLRDLYFLVLLLALHQRFKLMDLSEQVAKRWLGPSVASNSGSLDDQTDEHRLKAFEEIRDEFLEFTARGYFAQIMQHEHHHLFYRKWQEVFQIRDLYEEVRDEVREMYQFLQTKHSEQIKRATDDQRKQMEHQAQEEEKRARRLSMRISILACLIVIPSIVFGFLGINIRYFTSGETGLTKLQSVLWSAGGIVVLLFIAYLMLEAVRRYSKPD
jgi:hypothetical protein